MPHFQRIIVKRGKRGQAHQSVIKIVGLQAMNDRAAARDWNQTRLTSQDRERGGL